MRASLDTNAIIHFYKAGRSKARLLSLLRDFSRNLIAKKKDYGFKVLWLNMA